MTAAQLGETDDPKALVPGNVGAVTDTMWAMRSYGDMLQEAGTGLARIDTVEGWRGEAADHFRKRFRGELGKWTEAGECFHRTADALDSYDSTLNWAQQQAGEAVRLWNDGQAATAAAKAEHVRAVQQTQRQAETRATSGAPVAPTVVPFHDPGEASREAARRQLASARQQLDSAGDTAERTIAAARTWRRRSPVSGRRRGTCSAMSGTVWRTPGHTW